MKDRGIGTQGMTGSASEFGFTESHQNSAARIEAIRTYFRKVDAGDPTVLDLFSEDLQMYFPKFGLAHGKRALVTFADRMGANLASIGHDIDGLTFHVSGNTIVVEGREWGTTRDGRAWPDGAISQGLFSSVFEFDGPLIRRMHIYVDPDFTSSDHDRIRILHSDSGSPASRPAGKTLEKGEAISEQQDMAQSVTKAGSDPDSTEITRQVVEQYFSYMAQGKTPEAISGLFDEKVDWDIPGDVRNVPWIGKRSSRGDIADFVRTLRRLTLPVRFEVRKIIANMEEAVALGALETRVESTQKMIKTDFAFYFVVKNNLIKKFRLLEDSFAVAQAVH